MTKKKFFVKFGEIKKPKFVLIIKDDTIKLMIGMKEYKKKHVAGSLVNYNNTKNPQLRTIALIYILYMNVSDHNFFVNVFY